MKPTDIDLVKYTSIDRAIRAREYTEPEAGIISLVDVKESLSLDLEIRTEEYA